jgi:cohesin complex subunit SCC1
MQLAHQWLNCDNWVPVGERGECYNIHDYFQVDDADVVEAGKEAEAEERRWNKRSQQMLMVLNKCLHRHDSVTFRQMAPPSATHSRKQAAAKFYTFLVLKKMEAIDVTQELPYGDILISRGPKFELLG